MFIIKQYCSQLIRILTQFRPKATSNNGSYQQKKAGLPIVYIEGSQVIIKKYIVFLSLKINLEYANSADPDEMLHAAIFHLDLLCLPK